MREGTYDGKREGTYDGRREGTDGCFMLMYGRNQHNIVKQLSSD